MAENLYGKFQRLRERAEAEKEVSFYGDTLEDVIRVSEEKQSKDPHKVTVKIDFEKIVANIPEFSGKSGSELVKDLESLGIYLPSKEITIEIPTLESYYENIKNMEAKKQKEQGDVLIESKESNFSNWAKTVNLPVTKCHPKNVQDLISIIKNPDHRDKKISLAASTHSWPNLFGVDNSLLIDFMTFNSFPDSNWHRRANIVNKEECLVDVSAGCSILQKYFNFGFFCDPMLIPSNVIFTNGQYVGVSSTGCHGCSFEYGTISDQIQSINFLDCDGNNQRLDCEKDIAELRSGAIGLGSYGIITEMRLKMVQNIMVVTERHYWTRSEAKWNLENRPQDWISFEIYWWPFHSVSFPEAFFCIFTGRLVNWDFENEKIYCQIVRHVRTKTRYDKNSKSYLYPDKISNFTKVERDISQLWPYIIQEILLVLRKYVLKNYPIDVPFPEKYTPLFHKIIVDCMDKLEFLADLYLPKVTSFYNACHYLPFVSVLPILINDIELCFRTSSVENDINNFDNMFQAIEELGKKLKREARSGRFPVTLCVEGRIVAGSPCPLASCYSTNPKELFFYLEILAFQKGDDWIEFGKVFFDILKSIDPKVLPSMGKEWTFIEGMYEHIKQVCEPGLLQLKELQQKYDKDGRFMSPVVEKLVS